MALVAFLGLWLAVGPASGPRFPLRPGAATLDLRIGQSRGVLEAAPAADPMGPAFRLFVADPAAPDPAALTDEQVIALFGPRVHEQAAARRSNPLFRLLNITSWVNLVWIGVGLGGQLAFTGRMVLQWIVSEKRRESVITESFWWFSLIGAVALFSYFVWRQDPVGVLGQSTGLVIYARNLRLIHKQRRRARRAIEPGPAATDG
jgi:lipid-A-disaccharide synthase-like uncharacterized protein